MNLFILLIALIMYVFIIVFPGRKDLVSLGAALVVMLVGAVAPWQAFTELVNWNVLLIYLSCLVIADLFIYSGMSAYLAERVVAKSPSLPVAVVAVLMLTGFISVFVENVATVLVMAPIALQISRRAKMDPAPFLIGLALMANLQGTATLVGDPPSIIFASFAGYGFNDFFFYAGRASIFFAVQAGAVAGALYFLGIFRGLPKADIDLEKVRIVSLVPSILLMLMILGLAAISFLAPGGLHPGSGLWCAGLGAAGLLWLVLIRRESPARTWQALKALDWSTVFFLIGIYIVIGAVGAVGLLGDLADGLGLFIGGNELAGFIIIVAFSVLVSGFVDNMPYIVAMLPVADKLAKSLQLAPELFMFGLLIGACLGGNLTPFGASANVVVVGVLRKEGRRTSFLQWIKIGVPFTVATTAVSVLLVYLVWR